MFIRLSLFITLMLLLVGCSPPLAPSPSDKAVPASVRIVATQNFGQVLVFDKTIDIKEDSNALSALKQVARVGTAYGGGFVNSIDDIRSKYKGAGSSYQDWFLFINGLLAGTGAGDYKLHPGDIEQWDFHRWSFHQMIPATIGQFPETFSNGYGGKVSPTIVAYDDTFRKEAEKLDEYLARSGVKNHVLKKINDLSQHERETANLILLGTQGAPPISELNRQWRRLGFFAYFDQGNLVVLKSDGTVDMKYGSSSGLIQATQNPWNSNGIGADENVVWIVSGTDETGIKDAAGILINHGDLLKYACSAVTSEGKTVKLPR